ncbi:hypothetical protein KBD20_00455 [Candidatus Saccharibacteria bacterium]|nr:hypothetical protein [Candidatus Saccharibacteria bacterium]
MTETQKNTKPEINKDHPVVYAIAGFVLGACMTVSVLGSREYSAQQDTVAQPTTTEEAAPRIGACPKAKYEGVDPNVAMALTNDELSKYTDELRDSASFDESTKILNSIFKRWDYQVFVGEVPSSTDTGTSTHPRGIEHEPSQINQSLLTVSAIHILESLNVIPEPLMSITKGTKLYLTMNIVGESGWYGGLYTTDKDSTKSVIVGIGPNDPSGKIFEHELTHNLLFRLCGDEIAGEDTELAALNPESFQYSRLSRPYSEIDNITASEYGAFNSTEDAAELFPTVLRVHMGELCYMNDAFIGEGTPICDKLNLLLSRIAAKSPETAAYLNR